MEKSESGQKKQKNFGWLWIIIIIAVLVVGLLWWTDNLTVAGGGSGTYQAVFLTNDQVYFGKLHRADSQYPVLEDVFYLQVTQTLQPSQSNPGTNINLVKLGGELHGPADQMVINREHILFYEDLKEDSQVVTAINQFKASQVSQ